MPPVTEFLNVWLLLPLAGVMGLLIALLFSKRIQERVISVLEAQKMQNDLLKAPDKIQNRADVIRAFHQLAYRIAAPVEEWWTHRNIMRQACRNSPSVKSPIQVAVEIYELARYQPSSVELSGEQLDTVRKALRDCEAIRKG